MPRRIGTLAEKSLHIALKALYIQPGDALECDVDGYVIDIVRPSTDRISELHCIEIQTRNLGGLKAKLHALLDDYPFQIVYPIPTERFIMRVESDGEVVSRRKSPKHGTIFHLFPELVSFPALVGHRHLSLEIPLIQEEEIWLNDGQGSWRRKGWSIYDRRLLGVEEIVRLASPADFAALLPAELPEEFDSGELARAIHQPRFLAQKMAYCLREMDVLLVTGKRGNALQYRRKSGPQSISKR